jgi:hypothetical protein
LGNQKPAQLRDCEDSLWAEVLMLAEGRITTADAFRHVKEKWESDFLTFDSESAQFFKSSMFPSPATVK